MTITETEALVAIDIDSGAANGANAGETALRVNLEAAQAIGDAAQLRELGGRIVIDPPPMRTESDKRAVLSALQQAFADDERRVTIGGYSKTGLIDLVRERTGPSLSRRLTRPCPTCDGTARVDSPSVIARRVLADILSKARAEPSWRPTMSCAPDVAALLDGESLRAVEQRLARPVAIAVDHSLPDGACILDAAGPAGKSAP